MTAEQKTAGSSKDFFRKLRKAAQDEDFAAIDEVMGEAAGGAYGEVARQAGELQKIKDAICSNLSSIIRICDSIIGDPKADPKEVAWAKDKKKTAQEDQAKQGCPKQPVA